MPHGRVARGAKGQKIRSQWRWLKKIRKIRNIHFVVNKAGYTAALVAGVGQGQ